MTTVEASLEQKKRYAQLVIEFHQLLGDKYVPIGLEQKMVEVCFYDEKSRLIEKVNVQVSDPADPTCRYALTYQVTIPGRACSMALQIPPTFGGCESTPKQPSPHT